MTTEPATNGECMTTENIDRLQDAESEAAALRQEVERLRGEARDHTHALWQFRSCAPSNVEMLRRVADEIDCGSSCDHGYTEHDTGSFVCPKDDKGECPAHDAAALRDLAKALEIRADLTKEPTP